MDELSKILTPKAMKIAIFAIPFFTIVDINQGNVNTICSFLLVYAFKKRETKELFISGILAGLATFKPNILIVLPFLIFKEKKICWPIVYGIILGISINWGITFLFVNPFDFLIGAKTGLDREGLWYFWATGLFHNWLYTVLFIIFGQNNKRREVLKKDGKM
jgi:hypothetical protein